MRDGYPVTKGHTLVIPKRHIATWFDATPAERMELWSAIDTVCEQLQQEYSPDGFNFGINSGEAAGQTMPHLHLHVIPRYQGDMDDPRGGVRHPQMGNYKSPVKEWWDCKLEGDLPIADPVEWMVALPGRISDRVAVDKNSEIATCRFSVPLYTQLDPIYADQILGAGEHTQ